MAVRHGQDRLARVLGIATLVGSIGVVLLATALVGSSVLAVIGFVDQRWSPL
jgi:hypothetical protein